jgi:hypothetical protein
MLTENTKYFFCDYSFYQLSEEDDRPYQENSKKRVMEIEEALEKHEAFLREMELILFPKLIDAFAEKNVILVHKSLCGKSHLEGIMDDVRVHFFAESENECRFIFREIIHDRNYRTGIISHVILLNSSPIYILHFMRTKNCRL